MTGVLITGVICEQVVDEADRMMEEIKQDWLSLVDKAVYREQSTTDSQIYLNTCQRLAPGPLTLEKYENCNLISHLINVSPRSVGQVRI